MVTMIEGAVKIAELWLLLQWVVHIQDANLQTENYVVIGREFDSYSFST
jgi:hypothetical protein